MVFLKQNQLILNLYKYFQFIKTIDFKDFLYSDLQKIKLIFTVKPYTMLGYPRLSKLYELSSLLEEKEVKGAFVECGVWNGGSAGIISKVARDNKNQRDIYLFDSWQGQPSPTKYDVTYKNSSPAWKGMDFGYKE